MGYTVWHFVREADGRVSRVPSARLSRLWRGTERWPERAGQDLEVVEITLEVDRRVVRRLLRVLPIRLSVADDGRLDQEQHSRLALRRLGCVFREDRSSSLAELIGQLEADANYFWEPTSAELASLAERLGRTHPEVERAVYRP
jgi:hypothetical protein